MAIEKNYVTVPALSADFAIAYLGGPKPFKVVNAGPDPQDKRGAGQRVFEVYSTEAAWSAEQRERALQLVSEWRDKADDFSNNLNDQLSAGAYDHCATLLEDLINR